MKPLRSNETTTGRKMAGARALWRANGMKEEHFGKPVIAIVNSFTQLVPGHTHLHEVGQTIKQIIESHGCFAAEFNTIAIDDGIAMGHSGMLYSLPSRDLIADSIEYMCNAHKVDGIICISNCDKITPGMVMAGMRLNIPAVFVSGGPMEAGRIDGKDYDLVDIMVKGGDNTITDSELLQLERHGCPSCGCCSGMFTANSMNCLTEALGLSPAGNGTVLATHAQRKELFVQAANLIVKNTTNYYFHENNHVLPRSIATRAAFLNAMVLDIAMGGSTNTVLHLLAIANEAGVDFTLQDIDMLSRKTPVLCKVSPSSRYHIQDVNRAGGVMGILSELEKGGHLNTSVHRVDAPDLQQAMLENNIMKLSADNIIPTQLLAGTLQKYLCAPGNTFYTSPDINRETGCIRDISHAYMEDGGLAVLYGNLAPDGCVVKTAGVDKKIMQFRGDAIVFESQEEAVEGISDGTVKAGNVVVIRYEGPKGGPGMQEMLYPTSYLKSRGLDTVCALITDGRFSGGTSGLSIGHISPEAADKGAIALLQTGDVIEIDIPNRRIEMVVSKNELRIRKEMMDSLGRNAYQPKERSRGVSNALKAYARFVSSADKGAIRIID